MVGWRETLGLIGAVAFATAFYLAARAVGL